VLPYHPKPQSVISFVGPFPPPVHGQSLVTLKLHDAFVAAGLEVFRIDTGEGGTGKAGIIMRMAGFLKALVRIATRRANAVYLSVNSGSGIWLTSALAFAARITGQGLVCHLHSSRYGREHVPGFAFLVRCAGKSALYLTNCDDMATELVHRYPGIGRARGYGNAGFVDHGLLALPARGQRAGITLGHMSNLSLSKGVGRAIDLLRLARGADLPVSLLLAGPFAEAEAERLVAASRDEFGDSLVYLGPVYGEAKIDFFARTDIFVFPTHYINEAGPLVNLEAMAAGAPVISTAQCCIPSTLAHGGGVALDRSVDFAAAALPFVEQFARSRETMPGAARRRFEELLREQRATEAWLIDQLRNGVANDES
jgi:glycosyltransferase involved in cell wall biosynthesis